MRRFVEVSHIIEAGMTSYPGLPMPEVETILDYDGSRSHYRGQAEFFIASLHLCGNTGTYVDSPVHRFRDAADLSQLPLDRLAHLGVVVIDVRGLNAISPESVRGKAIADRAVL